MNWTRTAVVLLAAGTTVMVGCNHGSMKTTVDQTEAAAPSPAIQDAKAMAVLKGFGSNLAGRKSFRLVSVDTIDRPDEDGNAIQYIHDRTLVVRHPDRFRLDTQGDLETESIAYDGSKVSIVLPKEHAAGSIDAPATVNETIRELADNYGIRRPMIELASTDTIERIEKSNLNVTFVGTSSINGQRCNHIMISAPRASWQLWIDDDTTPDLRRMVVQYKEAETQPRYCMTVRSIEYDVELPDSTFEVAVPADAEELKIVPVGGK